MTRTMRQHQRLLLMLGVITLIISAAFVAPSQAQVGGNPDPDRETFELEGNAKNSPDYDGEDWETVWLAETAGGDTEATATAWESEMGERAASIFTGGGSKDPQMIGSWRWKDGGGLPDKDNLLHAFAARYQVGGTKDLLVFGSDRYDNSGDAMQGFWFLQDRVSPSAGGGFSGEHRKGDLLILSDFSIGGTVSTIAIYQWVDSGGDVAEHLKLVASSTDANCLNPDGTSTSGDVCGVVNKSDSDGNKVPWPFTDKSGSNDYLQGEFFEAGIDLAKFAEFKGKCYASFVAETRSSTSPTATLKDFVIGSFESCGVEIDTTPSKSTITLGDSVYDHAVVTGTGIISAPTPTGTMDFYVCGPDKGLCSTGYDHKVGQDIPLVEESPGTAVADSPLFKPDKVGKWCFRGEYSGDRNYPAAVDYDASECFTVTDTSSIVSDQAWVPNDSATITSGGGSALKGTLTFTLYDNGTCDGKVLYTESMAVDHASPKTFSTANKSVVFTEADSPVTVSWQAVFDSVTNSADSTGPCEVSTVTIDDNDPSP